MSVPASVPSPAPRKVVKMVPQPVGLNVELFPHQRANIYNMQCLERDKAVALQSGDIFEGNVSVLGDPPGTGKTLTVIGLILMNKMKWEGPLVELNSQVSSNINGSIRITRKTVMPRIQTTLIVTPLSIFGQWENELKHAPELTYKMVKTRAEIVDVEHYDVVICTVNMYQDLTHEYSGYCFKRFVYDEMDSAYISSMNHIHAGHYWFISATFLEVLRGIYRSRNTHFMKRLFSNIIGEYSGAEVMDSITVRSDPRVRALRPTPFEYKSVYYEMRRAPVVQHLAEHLDADVIQMIDAGNIKDAIRHLGGVSDDTNIADLLRQRASKKVHDAEMKVREYHEPQRAAQRAEWEVRLLEARRALANIEQRIEQIKTDTCGICFDKMQNPVLFGCCQNISCAKCSVNWVHKNKSCPFCRSASPPLVRLTNAELNGDDNDEKDGDDENDDSDEKNEEDMNASIAGDKFGAMVSIAARGKKVLVFAAHDNQFQEICVVLRAQNISYSLVIGSVAQRQKALNGYTNGDTKVLVLNSRMNGAGLNLQVTTDIILWHAMSDPLTKQIIGRALRYGIDHPLTVHKLFTRETEEQMRNGIVPRAIFVNDPSAHRAHSTYRAPAAVDDDSEDDEYSTQK